MDKKISDEQIDRVAGQLVRDFSLETSTLDEIADSPQLWWSVRKSIGEQNAPARKGWLSGLGWMIPAFSFITLGVCFGAAVWLFSAGKTSDLASSVGSLPGDVITPSPLESPEPKQTVDDLPAPDNSGTDESKPAVKLKNVAAPRRIATVKTNEMKTAGRTRVKPVTEPAKETTERKTDFIALSYAGNSEGGQVVRVKVPSEMMVTLGVVSEVEKNSAMVSAEVVVGDDGLARAIRFIR